MEKHSIGRKINPEEKRQIENQFKYKWKLDLLIV